MKPTKKQKQANDRWHYWRAKLIRENRMWWEQKTQRHKHQIKFSSPKYEKLWNRLNAELWMAMYGEEWVRKTTPKCLKTGESSAAEAESEELNGIKPYSATSWTRSSHFGQRWKSKMFRVTTSSAPPKQEIVFRSAARFSGGRNQPDRESI
jgi:hypothetical protein